ncbi:hypothetical protein SEA_DAUDAU_45 [Streptomyces phage Daudau]|uniref:Uncharacterized protein n=1 Tax=Streptomyces phage Daudau TaxID=2041206 RepID=A0A291LH70_9CAUD|nr:hypothetical protein KGG88_gp45 [Streptomyces phage Daudau]ATI18746.1 hypothetical protein SEA_DAUDAU_45 [Streptomyces phage Daudau]
MTLNLIETEFSTSTDEKPDWSIVTEETDGIAQRAARKAADSYSSVLEYEDAYQEALLLMATRPSKARAALETGPGALNRWLTQRLRDAFLTKEKHRSKQVSYEANLEALGEAE